MDKLWAWLTVVFLSGGLIASAYYSYENSVENEHAETASYVIIETAPPFEICTTLYTYTETIPPVTETKATDTSVSKQNSYKAENVVFPLNLNTASLDELVQLPGIGEVIAGNIISYRERTGGFLNRSQLLEVDGIGESRYNDIYDLVYLDIEYIIEVTEPAEEYTETSVGTSVTEWIPVIIDVNTATAEDFAYFPSVSPELAENIVRLRRDINGFKSILELLYAEGMTDEIYLSIDEYLVCEAEWSWQIG